MTALPVSSYIMAWRFARRAWWQAPGVHQAAAWLRGRPIAGRAVRAVDVALPPPGTLDLTPYMRAVVCEAAARVLERRRVREAVALLERLADRAEHLESAGEGFVVVVGGKAKGAVK